MQLIKSVALACGALATVASALPSARLAAEPRLLGGSSDNTTAAGLPSNDDFYKPTFGYQNQRNGAILKSRKVKSNSGAAAASYQLLFKTTDAVGNADATVTTILVPKKPKSPPKIISLQVPEDSVSLDCAPSASLASNTGSPNGLGGTFTTQGLEDSLNNGYYVVVPDHEGSKAAAFVGPVEGHAVLDSLRAVTNFPTAIPGVSTKTPVALGGYSGGAHAAAWASNLYSSYAPELNIIGQVIGGTPVNLTHIVYYINGGTYSGFAVAGVVGEYLAYPDIKQYIDANIYPNGTELINSIQNKKCILDVVLQYGQKDLFTYFKAQDPLNAPIPKKRLGENLLGGDGHIVKVPTILFHSQDDDVIPYGDALNYAKQQCAGGGKFHVYTDKGANHIFEIVNRASDLAKWLDQVQQGTADTSCNV